MPDVLDLGGEMDFLMERIKGLDCFLLSENWARTHFSERKFSLLGRRLEALRLCRAVLEEEIILEKEGALPA